MVWKKVSSHSAPTQTNKQQFAALHRLFHSAFLSFLEGRWGKLILCVQTSLLPHILIIIDSLQIEIALSR
ncbi:hypothetical protein DBR21_12735 [Caulobacter sp. HMWF009]|nr:hypothetical protein DBR21_12735 [Caulobacter sp. HMWF009]PTT05705.1 hypothetical protein DBR10_14870 [Caulobacter sp. HMWF025]